MRGVGRADLREGRECRWARGGAASKGDAHVVLPLDVLRSHAVAMKTNQANERRRKSSHTRSQRMREAVLESVSIKRKPENWVRRNAQEIMPDL